MECYQPLILITAYIWISTATEILYVLPDNSTNAVSCPSQPCATLSQYLLDNGTLPVVSNVEYHFLPGEHHVPANMILQNLNNFSIIGVISNSSSPVVLVGCSQPYVINIMYSYFVNINNVIFKHCIDMDYTIYSIDILITNSNFYNMDRNAMQIKSRCSPTEKKILITNCTFNLMVPYYRDAIVKVYMSPVNKMISFLNCKFYENNANVIKVSVGMRGSLGCKIATVNKYNLL